MTEPKKAKEILENSDLGQHAREGISCLMVIIPKPPDDSTERADAVREVLKDEIAKALTQLREGLDGELRKYYGVDLDPDFTKGIATAMDVVKSFFKE